MAKKINYIKEAFIWPYHLIMLIAGLAAGVFSGAFWPIFLIVAALEIIYMTFVPSSSLFQRYARNIHLELDDEDKKKEFEKIIRTLNAQNRRKYHFIAKIILDINKNYKTLKNSNPTSYALLGESITKLEPLKQSFVRLLLSYQNYTNFLQDRSSFEIKDKISELKRQVEKANSKTKKLIEKRLSIQQKRLERLEKVKINSEVILEQLKTIEDMLLFLQEQSLAVTDPSEVNNQLSSLFTDMECAEEAAEEMNSIMEGEYIAIQNKQLYQ